MTQQVQDLRDELEVIRDKANDEIDNLKSLLNVDAVKKEWLENISETLDNRAFDYSMTVLRQHNNWL